MSQELNESLAQMSEAGELDSSGDFTLASERAQAMMDRYLLEEPRSYILNLVAAGVASGSSSVSVKTTTDDCWVSFDGFTPTEEQLGDILSYAISDSAPPHLSELAIGVMGARALKPRWVRVTVVEAERTLVLTLGKERTFEVEPEGGKPLVEVHLKEAFSLKMLWRTLIRPEDELLRTRCKYAPIPLYLNGDRLDRLRLPTHALNCVWSDKEKSELMSQWIVESNLPVVRTRDEQVVGMAYVRRLKYPTPLYIVLDGVVFDCEEDLGWDGVGVLLYCSGLSKDLSQRQIVREEKYDSMLVEAKSLADRAVLNLLKSWPQLRGDATRARTDLVEAVLHRCEETEDLDWANSALTHLVGIADKFWGQKSRTSFQCRKARAELLVKSGRLEQAWSAVRQEIRTQGEAKQWAYQADYLILAESLMSDVEGVEADEQIEILEKLVVCYRKLGEKGELQRTTERLQHLCQVHGREFHATQTPSKPLGRPKDLRLCPQCGSSNLMKGSLLPGVQGSRVRMKLGTKKGPFYEHNNVNADVDAWACGTCGHISFALSDPKKAWDEYVQLELDGQREEKA